MLHWICKKLFLNILVACILICDKALLMFNPSNLDDVCVQATHLEARGKHDNDYFMKKSFEFDKKDKSKDKGKKTATITKEGEKPTCSHCQKGHDVSKCWKLHPELRPKKYGGNKNKDKDNQAATTSIIQDLGSDSSDEMICRTSTCVH